MAFMLVCGGRASWLCSLALLSACAASPGHSESSASAASAGRETERAARPDATQPGERARDARRDEMTWEEYYVDVERRARRSGGFVMWFNPPRPMRRASEPAPAGAAPSGGAPLSSSVR